MNIERRSSDIVARQEIIRADRDHDTVLYQSDFDAYEGVYETSDVLRIHLCVTGGGRLVRNSRAQKLDGLFIPGRVGLGAPYDGGEGFGPSMRLLALEISERRLKRLVKELPAGRLDMEALASTYHDDTLLSATLTAMWEYAGLHGFGTAFFDHALAIVVHRLGRHAKLPETSNKQGLSKRQLTDVIEFVEADLSADIRVADLANVTGLSLHHFSRCFRTTMGIPPYAFITRRRLDRAAEFLLESTMPIAAIATLVGYSDPSQFTAAFLRFKGVTPSIWRRSR